MALSYGFFNSVDGDRKYNADQVSEYLSGVVSNGIFEAYGNKLAVSVRSGLSVNIASGRAFIDCKWLKNDSTTYINLAPAHATLNRYSAIVIHLNYAERTIDIEEVQGTSASSPGYPVITDGSEDKYLILAYVYVAAAATTLTVNNLTDMRGTTRCPWVMSLLSPTLRTFSKRVQVNDNVTQTIYLDMAGYIPYIDDVVEVYLNGFKMIEGIYYDMYTSGTTRRITFTSPCVVGDEVYIEVITQVGTD